MDQLTSDETCNTQAFLQLWSGSMSQALIPEGELWEDPNFPADQK